MNALKAAHMRRRGLAHLAVCLAAALVLLTGGVLAGLHQHSGGEGAGHCALCSLASAHATAAPLAPQASAPSASPATRLPAPCRWLGRPAPAQPTTRAPPLA